jgi:hypothetical protein
MMSPFRGFPRPFFGPVQEHLEATLTWQRDERD